MKGKIKTVRETQVKHMNDEIDNEMLDRSVRNGRFTVKGSIIDCMKTNKKIPYHYDIDIFLATVLDTTLEYLVWDYNWTRKDVEDAIDEFFIRDKEWNPETGTLRGKKNEA